MIKILDQHFNKLGVIKNVIDSSRLEEINGENSLDFTAILDKKLTDLIDENSIFELENDYFDLAFFKKNIDEENLYTIEVESEHISYRLNDPTYDMEFFTEIGTPVYILTKILEGTEFSVGSVDFVDILTYSAQETKSRRQLLMEFTALLGGELFFNKKIISILSHRGSSDVKVVVKDRNVKVVSKTVNKRQLDEMGNPLILYSCSPIFLPGDVYSLGDKIQLLQKDLNINESLRVVKKTWNPYDEREVVLEFANYTNGLEDSLYRIQTLSVIKDNLYNGARIGPKYGFESIRNDKKARAYFRSDGLKFQSGDGSGETWKDRLYYDYDSETNETILVFDGKLSADLITALSAVITPNLYAEKATISELTVDSLETSTKVQNYLNFNTEDVNYIQIQDQTIKFITASLSSRFASRKIASNQWNLAVNPQTDIYFMNNGVVESTGAVFLSGASPRPFTASEAYDNGYLYRNNLTNTYYKLLAPARGGFIKYTLYDIIPGPPHHTEQATNRRGELMFWVDETHTAATTKVTAFPVYQYIYFESTKQSISFELENESGMYIPVSIFGSGTGVTSTSGQARQRKNASGLELVYNTGNGNRLAGVYWRDDGFVDVTARRADIKINQTARTIAITPEGVDQTDIVINYVESGNKLIMTWPDGERFDIEVT